MERQTWANMTDLLPRTAPNNRYTKKATHTKDSLLLKPSHHVLLIYFMLVPLFFGLLLGMTLKK